jgi:hypothetical protein
MAAIDLWQVNGTADDARPVGPSDREVVEALQRIASAQAHLSLAEARAREVSDPKVAAETARRNRAIESAHAELIWAQARLLSAERSPKVEQDATNAAAHERAVLTEHGFGSFRDYLHVRNEVPTTDTHLALARREAAAAQAAWEQLQVAMAPTMIIDLTGDEPRIL